MSLKVAWVINTQTHTHTHTHTHTQTHWTHFQLLRIPPVCLESAGYSLKSSMKNRKTCYKLMLTQRAESRTAQLQDRGVVFLLLLLFFIETFWFLCKISKKPWSRNCISSISQVRSYWPLLLLIFHHFYVQSRSPPETGGLCPLKHWEAFKKKTSVQARACEQRFLPLSYTNVHWCKCFIQTSMMRKQKN